MLVLFLFWVPSLPSASRENQSSLCWAAFLHNSVISGLDEHYEDNSLNLFAYFSSSCYSGYGDDEKVSSISCLLAKVVMG